MNTSSDSHESRRSTLVDRLRARAPGASDELIAEYRPAIVRFAYGYLGDSAAAEDAAQDVLVKALGATSTPDAIRPCLYRIARNALSPLRPVSSPPSKLVTSTPDDNPSRR